MNIYIWYYVLIGLAYAVIANLLNLFVYKITYYNRWVYIVSYTVAIFFWPICLVWAIVKRGTEYPRVGSNPPPPAVRPKAPPNPPRAARTAKRAS